MRPPRQPALDQSLYKHLGHLGWVVRDLDAVVTYSEKLGLRNIRRAGVQEFPDVTFRGRNVPTKVKKAFVDVDDMTIQWIEPVSGDSAYAEFLKQHGEGVQHLPYSMPSEATWREQIAWFHSKGVDVLQQGSWQASKGLGRFAYLDTAARGGGLTIELEQNGSHVPRTWRAV